MKTMHPSRRQFLEQAMKTAAFMALGLGKGRAALAAAAALSNSDPRFLINIHVRGGSDTQWWQNYFLPNGVNDYLAAGGTGTLNSYFTNRFDPSVAVTRASVNGTSHSLGVGMSMFSDDDFSKMAIWKGMIPAGSHDIGNRIINCGQFSNYAACFSSLISAALASSMTPLPLQYVCVGDTIAANYGWAGLLKGYALPACIPTLDDFVAMTAPLANELAPANLGFYNTAVKALLDAASRTGFRLKQSQQIFQSVASSLTAIGNFNGTNFGTSSEFKAILAAYAAAPADALGSMPASFAGKTMNDFLSGNGGPGTDGLTNAASSFYTSNIVPASFSFALAEFLITRGLTRVIDIGPAILDRDAHSSNGNELAASFVKYSMFRALLRRMAAAGPVPGTQGDNFLQHTTVVMTTEFDRTASVFVEQAGTYAGTNHGSTASCIIAGRGVKGGMIAGGVKDAPGAYGNGARGFSSIDFLSGLPIDAASGVPTPGGRIFTSNSIFPTIMAIFGVPIPAEQLTDGTALQALLAG